MTSRCLPWKRLLWRSAAKGVGRRRSRLSFCSVAAVLGLLSVSSGKVLGAFEGGEPSFAPISSSALFPPEEWGAIDAEARSVPVPQIANEPGCLTLEALIYNGPGDWILWVNGQRWTPMTRSPSEDLADVNAEGAHVRLRSSRGDERVVFLRPGDTYHPLLDRVTQSAGGE